MPNVENSPWVLLTVTGELDMSRTDELDEMAAEIDRDGPANIIVDLTKVTFMDSSALGWFLKLQERREEISRNLRLVAPNQGNLARLLSLSGLEGRFEVFSTVVEATATDPAGSSDGAGATDQVVKLFDRMGQSGVSGPEPLAAPATG